MPLREDYADGVDDWAAEDINAITEQVNENTTDIAGKADSSHAHAAADTTSGTFAIERIPTGTSSSTVCIGNDARLSNTRTPTDNTVTPAKLHSSVFGTSAGTVAQGNDARLSDARTPTAHTHAASDITGNVAGSNNGTAADLTLWIGTSAQYAAIGSKSSTTVYVVTP